MAHWQYHNPVAVHFGAGVLDTLPAVLRGRKASIVTFPEAQRLRPAARGWKSSPATRSSA